MAKPKLALIPAAQGTKLYSVLPSDGVGDFTFARGSEATRINAQGLIENVASGVSRLNYPMIDGVVKGCPHHILEPARTNLVTYSEDFSNSAWTKSNCSIISNSIISPDGTLNADKLVEGTSSSQFIRTSHTVTTGNNTISIYVKADERDWILLWDGFSSKGRYFDVKNGNIGGFRSSAPENSSIDDIGNGWYRCSMTVNSSSTNLQNQIYLADGDGLFNYTGDGTSGIYLWGAQFEQGSYPTSYIPNYGNAAGVTRSAETASGAGNATTFNDSEGVLMAEISALDSSDTTPKYISVGDLSDGTSALYFIIRDNSIRTIVDVLGSRNLDITKSSIDLTIPQKIAVLYKTNRFEFWYNGFLVGSTLTGGVYLSNALDTATFSATSGVVPFYGKTKQLQYFDSALTDNELEQLTSWTSFTDMANGQLYTIE